MNAYTSVSAKQLQMEWEQNPSIKRNQHAPSPPTFQMFAYIQYIQICPALFKLGIIVIVVLNAM